MYTKELSPVVIAVDNCKIHNSFVLRLVEQQLGFRAAGAATSLAGARVLLENEQPDVMILDVELQMEDGWDLLQIVQARFQRTRVIIFTALSDDLTYYMAWRAKVHAFISKQHTTSEQLCDAVGVVGRGGRSIAGAAKEAFERLAGSSSAWFRLLTDREMQLLPRIAAGQSDEEIACASGIQPLSAKSHRRRILHKLQLSSTVQLMRWANEQGFEGRKLQAGVVRLPCFS